MADDRAVEEPRQPAAEGVALSEPPKGGALSQAWLVLVMATFFGAALAGVEHKLGPVIAMNKLNETILQVPSLVPGAVETTPDMESAHGKNVFRALDENGRLVGWVVQGRGQGFADRIEVLIGLDASVATITGLFVLDQKETPGLGDNITTRAFRDRFAGIGTDVTLVAQNTTTNREAGVIQALSGATISSSAVCTIVNQTVNEVKEPLAEAARAASVVRGDR
ncbi:MAG: FMN-binding protein [Vicinamibacteria bacterium]|nr:FMN-binding protein [Vicinamibacteria bacterium]